MAITGVNSGVSSGYAAYYISKTDNKAKSEDSGTIQTSNTTSKNIDNASLKNRSVADYTKYLQEKYDYFNKSTSMEGIPTTVSVSSAFLKKCANDPEKAKYLEENLAAIPDCVSYAKSHALGTLTSISYEIDANGNITGISSGTNDPDGKIARENAERKAKENRDKEKKMEEKRAAKRAAEKRAEEKRVAKKAKEKRVSKETFAEQTGADMVVSKSEIKTQEKTSAYITQAINIGSNFNSYS